MAREALPNAPLLEVVYELRFPGDLSLFAVWGPLQAELATKFPKLFVSRATPGEAPLLQPMRLVSEDESGQILLSINTFAYSSKKYRTFIAFKSEFEAVYEVFRRHATIGSLTRLGLRYVNILPPVFGSSRQRNQLHPCLRLQLAGWSGIPDLGEGTAQLVFPARDGDKHLRLALLEPEETGPSSGATTGSRLDFDCYTTAADFSKVFPFLASAHEIIESAFFEIITPEYHQYLKGEA